MHLVRGDNKMVVHDCLTKMVVPNIGTYECAKQHQSDVMAMHLRWESASQQ